jgi:[ribosomal protein S18]-alanine N-acetyltransferase
MAGNTVRNDEMGLPFRLVDSNIVNRRERADSFVVEDSREPVSVRALGANYIDEIVAIERSSYPAPWSKNLLLQTLEQRAAFNLGLFRGLAHVERLVGYTYSFIVVDELHVLNIAIAPDVRGIGFGRKLFSELLAQSIERGVTYAMLEVRVTNLIAQGLYSSMGFRVGGLRRRYYRDNGEDALVLERQLTFEDLDSLRRSSPLAHRV